MDFIIIVLLLVVLVAGFLWWRSKQNATTSVSKAQPDALILENVDVGGVLHVSLMEEPYLDYKLVITGKNKYQEGKYQWFEIVGDNGGERVSIEYERDDELEVSLQIERPKLRELSITKDDLAHFDDEEDGSFSYKGITFYYEDSGEAVFYRNCDPGDTEKCYYWDFESKDGKHLIGCEMWSDGSVEVTYSISVKETNIEVLSLKG